MSKRVRVGAHRGAMCHAPENTLAAFEKAIEMGTYRVELDVRRCGDGTLIVLHDATLDRTTNGTGPAAIRNLEEIRTLRAGGTEPVPTLAEALRCARGRCQLLVEIKEAGLADDICREIAVAGMTDTCTISSFLEDELLRVRECDPHLATAYFLTTPRPFEPQEVVDRLGVQLLVVWPAAATAEIIAAAHQCGLQVRCGFRDDLTYADTFALFRRMADMGVDEIACGRPDWIRQMAEEYAEVSA